MNGEDVQQETGGDEMHDSGSYLNYKRKKRKREKERKEHLMMEEETVKQDGRMSVMESCNEKGTYSCELEENKTKRKNKRKEKYADCSDAQGKEVEAERNDMRVWNDNILTSSTCKKKKRKSKEEVKEKMKDKIIEQGKRINDDSNSSVPTIWCKSEMICEEYLLQENDEAISPTGDKSVHENNSSRKLNCHKSIDRSTEEVDHRQINDHTHVEEESIKHKVKKKKNRKYSNDGNVHDAQEREHVQYNLEQSPTETCNSEKREELSQFTGETSASVNCEDDEGKEKRKNRKRVKNICAGELECKKDEILQEKVFTGLNEHEHETSTQNDIPNAECSKARNKHRRKQDVCNSDIHDSHSANIEMNSFVNRNRNVRNMKPSMFAKLVDPSLVRFRGSNLCKIPGYGCY
jgi:hypothetical protein